MPSPTSAVVEAPPAPPSPWRGCRLRLVAELDENESRSASLSPALQRPNRRSPAASATCADAAIAAGASEEPAPSQLPAALVDAAVAASVTVPRLALPSAPAPGQLSGLATSHSAANLRAPEAKQLPRRKALPSPPPTKVSSGAGGDPQARTFVLPRVPSSDAATTASVAPVAALPPSCGASPVVPAAGSMAALFCPPSRNDARLAAPRPMRCKQPERPSEGSGAQSGGSTASASEATTVDVWGLASASWPPTDMAEAAPLVAKGGAGTAQRCSSGHRQRRRSQRRTSCGGERPQARGSNASQAKDCSCAGGERLQDEANKAFQAKNYSRAVALFTDAIDAVPDNHVLYSDRAVCLSVLGRYAEALKDGNRCIQLRPDWARGYGRKGLAEFCLGDFGAAADSYRKGLNLSPTDPSLQEGLNQAVESARQAAEEAKEVGVTLRQIFDQLDTDGNGRCTKREVIMACRKNSSIARLFSLPSKIHQEDGSRDLFEAIFQTIDSDDDRTISWHEFLQHFSVGRRRE